MRDLSRRIYPPPDTRKEPLTHAEVRRLLALPEGREALAHIRYLAWNAAKLKRSAAQLHMANVKRKEAEKESL